MIVPVAAQDILVITASGSYKLDVTQAVPTFTKLQGITTFSGVVVDTRNTPDNPPPTGDLVSKVKAIATGTIQNEQEARAVVAVVDLFLRPDADLTTGKAAFSAVACTPNWPRTTTGSVKKWNKPWPSLLKSCAHRLIW